ncbi:snRNA-activating protein complex, subunit 3 [Spinellus fusiger]|nr:snRNA-activating protein complex, subunit 3 [Spinellus fusiger]
MEGVTFNDIIFKINEPYLFSHQNNCQHLLMIRDMRLHCISDNIHKEDNIYPKTVYSWRYVRYKCSMCMIYPAEYMTMNDILSGFSPCYFCSKCFTPFHFDEHGEQVGYFDWIPYNGN